jgi:hypothetical protein
MVAMTSAFAARWEAERERRELAELEAYARLLLVLDSAKPARGRSL